MSYLDDPRVLLAAERTLLAWKRSTLALMAFGFVVERFGLFLRMVTGAALSPADRAFSLWLGIALLGLAAFTSVVATLQYRRVLRSLGAEEIPKGYWVHAGTVVTLTLGAVAVALAVLFMVSA